MGTYLIYEKETVALIIQMCLFTFFCFVIFFQIRHYESNSKKKTFLTTFSMIAGCAMISFVVAGFIYLAFVDINGALGMEIFVSVLATLFMAAGFFPQLLVVYRSKSPQGLSKLFIVMDMFGGIFAIISLCFREPFEYLAFMTYVVVPIFQAIQLALVLYYESKQPKYKNCEEEGSLEMGQRGLDEKADISAPGDQSSGSAFLQNDVGLDSAEGGDSLATNPFLNPALYKPLSSSDEAIDDPSDPTAVPNLIRSSYILSHNMPMEQEFDHIVPSSETDLEQSYKKQAIVLNQTSALFECPQEIAR
ncbi:hypothetical protein SAMD00019534_068280 [Acytostelium subglobosum LB1]|uniref:hypothetical protein n=1 Tax=Acytostelium subglobosum LB1 TaxID=1410327 RepID=UPI0006450B1E|nr:hypothetical protein SAMD00019534_068280 [Acytostelium subglobosum LB1]GAM23653.1 hypothetical protein SAMD00019534_068280 [Acytostelium subglobosum LB1]|eukprot:XP_012753394.1 hypothetical protein SAMD00019534_068280 [Acytostelium subglobosum LB1]